MAAGEKKRKMKVQGEKLRGKKKEKKKHIKRDKSQWKRIESKIGLKFTIYNPAPM